MVRGRGMVSVGLKLRHTPYHHTKPRTLSWTLIPTRTPILSLLEPSKALSRAFSRASCRMGHRYTPPPKDSQAFTTPKRLTGIHHPQEANMHSPPTLGSQVFSLISSLDAIKCDCVGLYAIKGDCVGEHVPVLRPGLG